MKVIAPTSIDGLADAVAGISHCPSVNMIYYSPFYSVFHREQMAIAIKSIIKFFFGIEEITLCIFRFHNKAILEFVLTDSIMGKMVRYIRKPRSLVKHSVAA